MHPCLLAKRQVRVKVIWGAILSGPDGPDVPGGDHHMFLSHKKLGHVYDIHLAGVLNIWVI